MRETAAPTPTSKDLAEFHRLMLRLGLTNKAALIAWADYCIASDSQPSPWALELAWSKSRWPDEIEALLRQVFGSVDDDLPRKVVAAVLRREGLARRISDRKLTGLWFVLFSEYPEADIEAHAADIWQYLDEVVISLLNGEDSPTSWDEAREYLRTRLNFYARFEPLARNAMVS
jgi:hypothetical protein